MEGGQHPDQHLHKVKAMFNFFSVASPVNFNTTSKEAVSALVKYADVKDDRSPIVWTANDIRYGLSRWYGVLDMLDNLFRLS